MRLLRISFAAACLISVLQAAPVEFLTDTDSLEPTTTFELRFEKPMIPSGEVGSTAEPSPLVIDPPIPGRFTWLSTRSGIFAPSEPPRLGVEYTFTLRPGLATLDGDPVGKGFRHQLSTPPFGISARQTSVYDRTDINPTPEVKLAFNLAVQPQGAEKLFSFVNDAGQTIPATVRYATPRDYFRVNADADDWMKRWEEAKSPTADVPEEDDYSATVSDEPQTNRLVITPVNALPTGSGWTLQMKPGLKSLDGSNTVAEPASIPLGDVKPFTLTHVTPTNFINSRRSVTLEFSQPIAPDITAETAGTFLTVSPEVPNLRFEEGWRAFVVRGDFELGKDYTVTIGKDVISAFGQPYDGERSRTFSFSPVAPRLYLPEITGHQMEFGSRTFEALSVNLRSLRVVAKLVSPENAATALAAFKNYDKPWDAGGDPDEPYQPLPEDAIPGEILSDQTIDLSSHAVDERVTTTLDWTQILGNRRTGVIFLTIEGEPLEGLGDGRRPGAQALMQLTDLGILWKKAGAQLRATVFSMESGTPLDGVSFTLLDEARETLSTATSDDEGFAELDRVADAQWLVARKGNDVHVVRMGEGAVELPTAAFGIPLSYRGWASVSDDDAPRRALLFTDRPLYRAGETVHVKGIVRRLDDDGLAIEANRLATLHVSNPRGDEIEAIQVETDARGSFDTQILLEPSVGPGRYGLRLELNGNGSFYDELLVAEYQPNAFEVDIAMRDRFTPQEKVRAQVTASYLFGAPLTQARAQWTMKVVRDQFTPEGFYGFQFGFWEAPEQASLTVRGEATFDGANGVSIEPELPTPKSLPSRGLLTVETTDINQQTVTETHAFTQDASDFYLGVSLGDRMVYRVGEPIDVSVVAVDPKGQPLDRTVPVKVEWIHRRFDTVRVQGAGDAISFRTETHNDTLATTNGATLLPIKEGTQWKIRDGATATFTPEKAGQYLVRVTAKDLHGNQAISEGIVFVSGPDAIAWDYRHPAQVDLVSDKTDYLPGETARVMVKTPIDGEATITIERGDRVLRTQRATLSGNAPVLEIPLEAGDGPNVIVSMVVIRGAADSTRKFKMPEYRYGMCELRVGDPVTKLNVQVEPARAQVEPGEPIDVTLCVLDSNGKPVPDAEVTFFAIDDGIISLTGYERPMPGPIFDAPIPLGVKTGLTLFQLIPEDPAELEFGNKGYLIGGGGLAEGGMKLRDDFPGTAAWMPSLITGDDGTVRATFPAPDALTRYRLVAVAQAAANRFGSGESAISIAKPLMLLPSVGQFGNVGDQLIARAVVRNDTGTDGEVEVTLHPANARSDGPTTTRIAVANGETKAVDFPVTLEAMGEATWSWSAKLGNFSDHVVSKLHIGSAMVLLRETVLSDLGKKTNDLLAGVNPQLLEGNGTATFTVANTRLSSLAASFDYLRDYEYTCAEQTASRLATFIAADSLQPCTGKLELPDREAAIDRLASMQTPDGGLAFWPGGRDSSLFASAYAATVLTLLMPSPEERPMWMNSLYEFLSSALRDDAHTDSGDRALALYALALAGQAEPSYHELLYQQRSELSHETRALLALAVLESDGSKKMVANLLNPRTPAPDDVSLFGSPARDRAIALLAWTQYKPKAAEVAALTKELLGLRVNGRWATTQDNAWALIALARYADAVEQRGKTVSGTLVVRDVTTPFTVNREQPSHSVEVAFDATQPLTSATVNNPDKGALFGEARFVVRPPVGDQPRQDRGFAVSRSYQKIDADGRLTSIDDLRVGDRVLVTLRVETQRVGHFVAIDDPLPAVLEAVNPDFRSQAVGGVVLATADFQEVRADRVLYFCDVLPPGAHTFQYLARVRSAGNVMAGATKAEQMYRPERFGLGETTRIVSRE